MLGEHSWYQPNGKWEHNSAAALITAADRVLDIGCGDGRFHDVIAAADYTGLDTSATLACRKLGHTAKVLNQGLAQHAEDEPAAYDVVCAFQVLEHVTDPLAFIRLALQCLRPGGRIMFGLPNRYSYLGGLVNFALNSPPHHLSSWSEPSLRAVEDGLGLTRRALQFAPVEDWERDLYWMQRCYEWAAPENQRYSSRWRWKWLIPMAYISAKLVGRITPVASGVRGSTMLWVAAR